MALVGKFLNPAIEYRRGANLPHWRLNDATYAVTFRLADSLPAAKLRKWRRERDEAMRAAELDHPLTDLEISYYHRLFGDRVEEWLDRAEGSCLLRAPELAGIVKHVLLFNDQLEYNVFAWCIMPNHVHVVVHVFDGRDLSDILRAWKGNSARLIRDHQNLRGAGALWQKEPYDHLIRDREDLCHQVQYVLSNPAKSRLKNWPWVGGTAYRGTGA